MINLSVKNVGKGSKILEIELAVIRLLEKFNISPKEISKELCEAPEEGWLLMVFVLSEISVDALSRLQSSLGRQYRLVIMGKSKDDVFFRFEFKRDELVTLIKNYSYKEELSGGQTLNAASTAPRNVYGSKQNQ